MAVGDTGIVTTRAPRPTNERTFRVTVTSETVRCSIYYVECVSGRPCDWRPAEVRVGEFNGIACLSCTRHPDNPCRHVTLVRRYLAAQPLEAVP